MAALLPSTTYTLTVAGVSDLSGNTMTTPATSTFATSGTVDFSVPALTSIIPSKAATGVLTNTTIVLQFSKYMNPLSINTLTFTATNGATLVPGTISVSQDGTTAIFTPNVSLAPSTTYTVQLSTGIIDLEGQSLAAYTSTFTTGTQ